MYNTLSLHTYCLPIQLHGKWPRKRSPTNKIQHPSILSLFSLSMCRHLTEQQDAQRSWHSRSGEALAATKMILLKSSRRLKAVFWSGPIKSAVGCFLLPGVSAARLAQVCVFFVCPLHSICSLNCASSALVSVLSSDVPPLVWRVVDLPTLICLLDLPLLSLLGVSPLFANVFFFLFCRQVTEELKKCVFYLMLLLKHCLSHIRLCVYEAELA